MADLEEAGLLYSPHTSAGRLPTEAGLRFFVDGLLGVGNLAEEERHSIESMCAARGKSLPQALEEATTALSGLSHCAGLVVVPKQDRPLKHIEFVLSGPGRALVVMVTEEGLVENRVIEVPLGLPPSTLVAAEQLSERAPGRPHHRGGAHRHRGRDRLAQGAARRVDRARGRDRPRQLGRRRRGPRPDRARPGQAARRRHRVADLERMRALFEMLETRETCCVCWMPANAVTGCRSSSARRAICSALPGCSLIIAPYQNSREEIVGAIGVIGPTRMNYARIIPMVDYTAKVIGRLIG